MTPDIVVDIGNTRIKWGLCAGPDIAPMARLGDDRRAWDECLVGWQNAHAAKLKGRPLRWAIAGVVPDARARFQEWVAGRGDLCMVLDSHQQIPLQLDVEAPERVGIDRLLNAVAARRRDPARAAILVDIGSAVTVDWLDQNGVFQGGTIFPGFRLMANALHQYTAQLPLVTLPTPVGAPPGNNTVAAVQTGIAWTVAGGVLAISRHLIRRSSQPANLFLTGGDALPFVPLLRDLASDDALFPRPTLWPEQTLEGIRLVAEGLP